MPSPYAVFCRYATPLSFVAVLLLPYFIPSWMWYLASSVLICISVQQYLPNPRGRKRAMSNTSETMVRPYDQSVLPGMPTPIINGALFFNELPSSENLQKAFKDSFFRYVRFNSVPVEGEGSMLWEDQGCDIESHFYTTQVDSVEEAMKALDGQMDAPLRRPDQPLWEVHIVENRGDGASLINVRVHHGIGDGISLMKAFLGMLTVAGGAPYPMPDVYNRKPSAKKGVLQLVKETAFSLFSVLKLPVGPYDSNLAITSSDKKALVYSGTRHVVRCPEIDLAWIKQMKDMAKVTVNDVMMCVTAGAIRRYCEYREDKGCEAPDVLCRALLPVAFPRKDVGEEMEYFRGMRNLWCFVSAELLVGEADPVKRLAKTNLTTKVLKTTPLAPVQLYVQNAIMPYLPVAMAHQAFRDVASRHSMVFSNVPGPEEAVFVAGKQVVGMQMVFPNLITQIGVLSYNGKVFMNFTLDPVLVQESEKLADFYLAEFKVLGEKLGCPTPPGQ